MSIDGNSPTNAVIYIKDEDALNPDDLLAAAFADEYGRFEASWTVRDVDVDSEADIYAVFEGNDRMHRLTTCGSGCSDTQKLSILEPSPPPENYGSGAHMKLWYSLPFAKSPTVAIVTNPESYEDVKGHIVPVREGIEMLGGMLEARHGGNWDVDFEVIHPSSSFADRNSYDIVIAIVRSDEDFRCSDAYGWVLIYKDNPKKPVDATICSDRKRDNAGVSATSAHEFIHAMGIGHTFNVRNDRMCSVEPGYGKTCPGTDKKSNIPSELNLDAIAYVYGRDGFRSPNNPDPSKIFLANDPPTWGGVMTRVSRSPRVPPRAPRAGPEPSWWAGYARQPGLQLIRHHTKPYSPSRTRPGSRQRPRLRRCGTTMPPICPA